MALKQIKRLALFAVTVGASLAVSAVAHADSAAPGQSNEAATNTSVVVPADASVVIEQDTTVIQDSSTPAAITPSDSTDSAQLSNPAPPTANTVNDPPAVSNGGDSNDQAATPNQSTQPPTSTPSSSPIQSVVDKQPITLAASSALVRQLHRAVQVSALKSESLGAPMTPPIATPPTSSHHDPAPAPWSNGLGQFESFLSGAASGVSSLILVGHLPAARLVGWFSLGVALTLLLLLRSSNSGSFVAWLRKAGYKGAARSDTPVTNTNFVTPPKVSLISGPRATGLGLTF